MLIVKEAGDTTAYSIEGLEDRGEFFTPPSRRWRPRPSSGSGISDAFVAKISADGARIPFSWKDGVILAYHAE